MAAVPEQSAASPIKRVFTVAPMPPEKMAYALARYSRSPDSIVDSVEWVRTHDSAKFLESFYFQYGHASIADLGHLTVCFEGISELAAIEIEDEQLWDGQARSSRYQDFSQSNAVVPPDLPENQFEIYRGATNQLMSAYDAIHERAFQKLCAKLPRPSDMKPETYQRNLRARAFDVARYLLPLAVPTGLGQVTSIRSLERQIRRLKASDFEEVRDIADELAGALAHPADCVWDAALPNDPIAPTLAHHAGPDEYARKVRDTLQLWAEQNLPPRKDLTAKPVVLLQPTDHICDICATLLYPVTDRSYRELYQLASSWSKSQRIELMDLAIQGRERRDELTRHFRSAPYVFDIIMDIGAYRDLHRHRRCQQFRQDYTNRLGYEVPALVEEAGLLPEYQQALTAVDSALAQIAPPAGQYLLPFAARSRFLFKMDFAELEYISRLRSGVKGHFSYRKIAWEMKQALDEQDPSLGALVNATPPWVEDPLTR